MKEIININHMIRRGNMYRVNEIIDELRAYDSEREWFEFKENWF